MPENTAKQDSEQNMKVVSDANVTPQPTQAKSHTPESRRSEAAENDIISKDSELSGSQQNENSMQQGPTEPVTVNLALFTIHCTIPLSDYDVGPSKAFSVEGSGYPAGACFALRCDPGVPYRKDVAEALAAMRLEGVLTPLTWDVIYWPTEGRSFRTFVFERPKGKRLDDFSLLRPNIFTEAVLVKEVFPQFVKILETLHEKEQTYRAFRPDNVFWDAQTSTITLGDCVTTPPGFLQPVVYEPVESAMTIPVARGKGIFVDDIYSLAVLMLGMHLGTDFSKEEQYLDPIKMKLDLGSFIFLQAMHTLPVKLADLLRGMLHDDPVRRWSISELDSWVSGRYLRPSQKYSPEKTNKPFAVDGENFFELKYLSYYLGKNWQSVASIVKKIEFDEWVKRYVDSPNLAMNIEILLAELGRKEESAPPGFSAKFCSVLDPNAPMRYKGEAYFIDGLRYALAYHMQDSERCVEITEILALRMPMSWLSVQSDFGAGLVNFNDDFDQLSKIAVKSGMGFGPERCLYEIVDDQHCLSPMVESYMVSSVSELILLMEQKIKEGVIETITVDRHMLAFIAANSRFIMPSDLTELNSDPRSHAYSLALMNIFSGVQRSYKLDSLPGFTRKFVGLLEPVIHQYKNKVRRAQIQRRAEKAAKIGDLTLLLRASHDLHQLALDESELMRARLMYKHASLLLSANDKTRKNIQAVSRELGEQISAVLSGILAALFMYVFF